MEQNRRQSKRRDGGTVPELDKRYLLPASHVTVRSDRCVSHGQSGKDGQGESAASAVICFKLVLSSGRREGRERKEGGLVRSLKEKGMGIDDTNR
ncbi:hypothetical protein RRG08_003746 [Elysia crispata]|uniref:Uncharacterized protein n=1 Tax=Elysia crispata TaxID=231223 RepID=A0AAE1AVE7_9GAST|nr:hypothetical protein RRG08_003746 [Elysia crispata]